jgi:hypothetical protein
MVHHWQYGAVDTGTKFIIKFLTSAEGLFL